MKKEPIKISANEVNRFIYCPYQWYYKRTYGMKVLNEQYKHLNLAHSNHDSFYEKGSKYHQKYHRNYQNQRVIQMIIVLVILAFIIGAML